MATVNDLINAQSKVKTGDIIKANDVSNNVGQSYLVQALDSLLNIINTSYTIDDNITTYDHDTTVIHNNNPNDPQYQNIVKTTDLTIKHALINSLGNDCICYADCSNYARWKYKTCSCNIDCQCNYFYYN